MFKLRSYQTELIKKISRSMHNGNKRIIVQSPPRTGKTVVMAEVARQTTFKNNHVLFVVHRKEVLQQAENTFLQQNVKPNLLKMGMVQSLSRHIDQLDEPDLILIDEAHHALSKSYQKILQKFKKAYVLYFTATPIRTGKQQLDLISDDIIIGQSIKELTKKGFLAPFRYFQPPSGFEIKKLKKSSTGDYTQKSMSEAESSKLYGGIVEQYQKIALGKQAVVYAYSIASAKKIANEFNLNHISAVEVDGSTPENTREHLVNNFKNQKIKILVNVNLFTEGVDLPDVECVIIARPTASLSLYLQFAMRCLNPKPGKTAFIMDHANCFKTFGYPDDDRDWKQAIITKTKRKSVKLKTPNNVPIITCDYCFAVVKPNDVKNGKCPICGNKIKVEKFKEIQKEIDLVEANRKAKKRVERINKKLSELHSYSDLKTYAKEKGYKPGWVYIQAKLRGYL